MIEKGLQGDYGATMITDTAAKTGVWNVIQCLTETTFTLLTSSNWTGSIGSTICPAGTTLYGRFTAITLATGAVIAYKKYEDK